MSSGIGFYVDVSQGMLMPGCTFTVFAQPASSTTDGSKQIEIRVLDDGRIQVFADAGVEMLPFSEWVPQKEAANDSSD